MKKLFVIVLISTYSLCANADLTTDTIEGRELDEIVTEVCNKRIVLLGEDSHHGSGKTMEVKIQLVKRLIDECQFSRVFFESPVYEFLNFEYSVSTKTSSKRNLAQSIGGLWSQAKPMATFVSYLHSKALQGKVSLAGIDSQLGAANQPFSQSELAARLSRYLSGERVEECEAELFQYLNWQYNESTPYDESTKKRISVCVSDIKKAVDDLNRDDETYNVDKFMIDNFYRFLQFSKGDYFNLRDRSMAENVKWHLSNSPKESKVIIWCATIHAAKSLSSGKEPMAFHLEQLLKEQVFSIGFSALSGGFGRKSSQIKSIVPAPLEQRAFLGKPEDIEISYLSTDFLKTVGEVQAQPITYNRIESANWSERLDAIIVLREEEPIVTLD
jgi:erythromycin esterase-like protein